MNLSSLIEAILFWRGDPVTRTYLAKATGSSDSEIRDAVAQLRTSLASRGLALAETADTLTLVTAPGASATLKKLSDDELSGELSRAALETLAIVLYDGHVNRSTIDEARGVNSSFILRNLLIRGLIERVADPNDQRSYLYRPTTNLLAFLGISRVEELPDFAAVTEKLRTLRSTDNDTSAVGQVNKDSNEAI